MTIFLRFLCLFMLGTFVVGGSAFAQVGEQVPPGLEIPTTVSSANDFLILLENIVNWIFVIVLVGAVIMIVLAGWQFISGGGEPQQVAQARSKLLWAAVGIGVAVLSQGIITAIRSVIGAP